MILRGSLSTSIPGRVYLLLKEQGPLRRGEIGQALDGSPNAISVALVNLCHAGALRATGKRNELLYKVTGLDYPIHPPKPPPPPQKKQKPAEAPKPAPQLRPAKQAKRPNEPAPLIDDNYFPKEKAPGANVPCRVLCAECERFGVERGCRSCTWTTG